ncbi:MAG: DNA replication/repair protein RecF [Alphaproteobacteria bacterium]
MTISQATQENPTYNQQAGISRLYLRNYRSYSELTLQASPAPIVLTGPNGAGKTNVLEAISLLSVSRGIRSANIPETRKHDAPMAEPWNIAALLTSTWGDTKLSMGITGDGEKHLQVNGATVGSRRHFAQHLHVLWLAPSLDQLFTDNASGRRRFLDRLISGVDPYHSARLSRFEKAMRERNKLLKDGRTNASWYQALEIQIAAESVAIAARRLDFLEQLTKACKLLNQSFPQARLAIQGPVEDKLSQATALETETWLADGLAQSRRLDASLGRTSIGAHKADLIATFLPKNQPAALCSTGEQKALLLSLTLAAAHVYHDTGEGTPILLLDEVVAHLDPSRRSALMQTIEQLGIQTWMTGTDADFFSGFREKIHLFSVENSTIVPQNVL